MVYEAVCDGIDLSWVDDSSSDDEDEWYRSAPVKYFHSRLSLKGSLKQLLVRNPTTRLGSRIFDLVSKCVICILFIVRAQLDDLSQYKYPVPACYDGSDENITDVESLDQMVFSTGYIHWYVLVWVQRPLPIWILQVVLSVITLTKSALELYIAKRGTRWELAWSDGFILELICSLPILATVLYPPILRDLFAPIFFNCWLAKLALEKLANDLHLTRQRFQTISVTMSQQIIILVVTISCIVFTTVCGMQHIQRGSACKPLTMWESLYFVIVTFSTVGYGDISPDIWLGQVFIMVMICIAFAFIPRQLEGISSTWREREKCGGDYSKPKNSSQRHVVVCVTTLTSRSLMDFLIEFYAHPKLENHRVILLCSEPLDTSMQTILMDPKWSHRVVYMRGSVMNDLDLQRCRIQEATACFLLAPRNTTNRKKADQHTILRSWSVKDVAPDCRQYIQLFQIENKIHVQFAEHVVCEDEFSYALLANNCLYPGLSTLVTLLLRTNTGKEARSLVQEPWQRIYGRHSGNEVYHIQLSKSLVFREYENKTFNEASVKAHERFGVCLLAIVDMTRADPQLQLNPGTEYKLKGTDYCFYLGITKEEHIDMRGGLSARKHAHTVKPNTSALKSLGDLARAQGMNTLVSDDEDDDEEDDVFHNTLSEKLGINLLLQIGLGTAMTTAESPNLPNGGNIGARTRSRQSSGGSQEPSDICVLPIEFDTEQEKYITGNPPKMLSGVSCRNECHLMKTKRQLCCLRWGETCEHCTYKNANDERWRNQLIILCAQRVSNGAYNFILPLRSHFVSKTSLSPIILMLEEEPSILFLETIAHFPLVFWIKGEISSVDDLLRSGITKSSHFVVASRTSLDQDNEETESTMADSDTVVAVQTVSKMFPNANIITELSQASNIRFMQFRAEDEYSRMISNLEKSLRQQMSSNMCHIFRLPFAAGQVFSANMLDSLLYQTFYKGYLISFVRLLLGVDAAQDSGHLSSIRVRKVTVAHYKTYGQLYHALAESTGEIPIAIYRTEPKRYSPDSPSSKGGKNNNDSPKRFKKSNSKQAFFDMETKHTDMDDVVRNRLSSLGMTDDLAIDNDKDTPNAVSYVIANPTPKKRLYVGDLIYVIQPSNMTAVPRRNRRRVLSTGSRAPGMPRDGRTNGKDLPSTSDSQTPESPNSPTIIPNKLEFSELESDDNTDDGIQVAVEPNRGSSNCANQRETPVIIEENIQDTVIQSYKL